jgi:hypothetical protein
MTKRLVLMFCLCSCGIDFPILTGGDAGTGGGGTVESDSGFDAAIREPDAGKDSGVDGSVFDAGVDGGFDSGFVDAGFDGGFDSGVVDAGFDGGFDSGVVDAGFDAGTPPAAPTSLTIPAGTSSAAYPQGPVIIPVPVTLKWTDTANDENGFEVERSPDNANWGLVATLGPNSVSYLDANRIAGAWFYRVRSTKGALRSAWSNVDSVVIPYLVQNSIFAGRVDGGFPRVTYIGNAQDAGHDNYTGIGYAYGFYGTTNFLTWNNVDAPRLGTYDITVRYFNGRDAGEALGAPPWRLSVTIDSSPPQNLDFPSFDNQRWEIPGFVTFRAVLDAGVHSITFRPVAADTGNFHLNSIEVAPLGTWIPCAWENRTCTFNGTREVRYGLNLFNISMSTSPVACNSPALGEPDNDANKYCWYKN